MYGIDVDAPKLKYSVNGVRFEHMAFITSEDKEYLKEYELFKDMMDSLYVELPNLWEVFASSSDWVDENGNPVFSTKKSVFNIKPFGFGNYVDDKIYVVYQGLGAMYYASPLSARTFFSLKKGIGHYDSSVRVWGGLICYAVRLVKDIK